MCAPAVTLPGVNGVKANPTLSRALWSGAYLFVEFLATAPRILAPGRTDGIDHFKIGDVCEVFLAVGGQSGYLEVHVTPGGYKTVYFFSGPRVPAPLPGAAGDVQAFAQRVPGGWRAVIGIPWSIAGTVPHACGREVLFGRYDYGSSSGDPVLSSFPSQNGQPDFHCRDRYASLQLRQ